jgi:outer membrane protein OmpA-like peptidoglycan-associated protein
MITRPILMSLCAVMIMSACSGHKSSSNDASAFSTKDASVSLHKVDMQIYIASAESQLLLLEQQETNRCITGQLAIAQSYLTRAISEHQADMEKDAFITLVDFDRQLRKIYCINQYIKGQLGCGYTNKKVVLKRWYDEGDFDQCQNTMIAANSDIDVKENHANKSDDIERNHMIITETLHDFNEYQIKPIYYPSLNKLVELIKHYPKSTLLISGHTDTKGSTEYNHQLSKKRAESVVKYFTDNGIEAAQIVIKNQGEESIREVEQSDVSRVFNRYTSITLYLDTSGKNNI